MLLDVTEIWTGNCTGKGVGLLRKVNEYFVVHKTENGVLWHTDMSMEQGWEMYFPAI